MSEEQKPAPTWAIVELFGHKRIAGLVSEHTMGGCAFVRVDVPSPEGPDIWNTHLYGQGAIYGMHFVSEDVARTVATNLDERPISAYDLPAPVRRAMLEYQDAQRLEGSHGRLDFDGQDDDEIPI